MLIGHFSPATRKRDGIGRHRGRVNERRVAKSAGHSDVYPHEPGEKDGHDRRPGQHHRSLRGQPHSETWPEPCGAACCLFSRRDPA